MPAIMLASLGMLSACSGPPASEGGFDSPDPAAKLYAIVRAGESRDASATVDLIEQLDSDDPAVRMMAIAALERVTGQRLGYRPYDTLAERRMAIERWAAWQRERTGGGRGSGVWDRGSGVGGVGAPGVGGSGGDSRSGME